MSLYARIMLPLAQGPFTFCVPDHLACSVKEGCWVTVTLGTRKHYTGIVWSLTSERPPYQNLKSIVSVHDQLPPLCGPLRQFWDWIAMYYLCHTGDVFRAAVPQALKPSGYSVTEVQKKYLKPRTEKFVRLQDSISNSERLNLALDNLQRAPRQYDALLEIAAKAGDRPGGEIPVNSIRSDSRILQLLEKKGMVSILTRELTGNVAEELSLPQLTTAQRETADHISRQFSRKQTVLLHGVTGSGKTEIYAHLAAQELRNNKSVMMIVPEIAMSGQLVRRMKRWFGTRVAVYHSNISARGRAEIYSKAASGEIKFILGVRSAIFVPLADPGLIIVDEEHDQSLKQQESQPRYHARDCAVVLAGLRRARVLLGSATPSAETYHNAATGKYGYVNLSVKYYEGPPPQIMVSDTLTAVKRGERKSHFNKLLLEAISGQLARGGQTILFQNRRGYAPYIQCPECGYTATCPHCSVSLTLHSEAGALQCHYCGYSAPVPATCPGCRRSGPRTMGFGTEKVVEELRSLFPAKRIDRLDRDVAVSQRRMKEIISSFECGHIDILVGTQMITKGFDFGNVSLIGILNADNLLFYPDFRASERAFQTLTQVAGRTGRRNRQDTVIIQTTVPANNVIRSAASGDYTGFIRSELAERQAFGYPPFKKIVGLSLRHKDPAHLQLAADELAGRCRESFGDDFFGPNVPAVRRIRDQYILVAMLKLTPDKNYGILKNRLQVIVSDFRAERKWHDVTIAINVDPQ